MSHADSAKKSTDMNVLYLLISSVIVWSLSYNVSTKTWWMLVFEMWFRCSFVGDMWCMLMGKSMKHGRSFRMMTSYRQSWFLINVYGFLVKSVMDKMQHISKTRHVTNLFYLEICDARWWVKSKSTIHVHRTWDVCNECFSSVVRCLLSNFGFWDMVCVKSVA